MNQAAKDHGILRITLKDRVSRRVEHGTNPDHPKYLNETEEKELVEFLIHTSAVGYGRSRRDVMCIAEKFAKWKNLLRKCKITQGWWREFLRRQEHLSLQRRDNTAHVRVDAVSEDAITHYFDLLKQTLIDNMV